MENGPDETTVPTDATDGDDRTRFAYEASMLLRALGHEGRLRIVYHLLEGERNVTELKNLLPASQSLVSSHLARLRHEGLVSFRKEGKTCVYFLKDEKVRDVLHFVDTLFCQGLRNHLRETRD